MRIIPYIVRFNTSHVVIYRSCTFNASSSDSSFNTSHVVIYHAHAPAFPLCHKFQYISCCYLSRSCQRTLQTCFVSIHLMLLFIIVVTVLEHLFRQSFNTSHVVIYQKTLPRFCTRPSMFQYISCCYLSTGDTPTSSEGSAFQYISCCYLSFAATASMTTV